MPDTVSLHSVHTPSDARPTLVLLHGLLGSSRNWSAAAKALAAHAQVFALDLRNHGKSGHAASMTFSEMAADVVAWADGQGLDQFFLLGHSLGGKTAMRLAVDFPERVEGLIIADIAPRSYIAHHRIEMSAMLATPLDTLSSRKEAEQYLEQHGVRDWAMRQFLLTNLVRDSDTGAFRWQVNLTAIDQAMHHLTSNPLDAAEHYADPALFLRGGQADFVDEADFPQIRTYFPSAEIKTYPDAGHNLHVDARDALVADVGAFLS